MFQMVITLSHPPTANRLLSGEKAAVVTFSLCRNRFTGAQVAVLQTVTVSSLAVARYRPSGEKSNTVASRGRGRVRRSFPVPESQSLTSPPRIRRTVTQPPAVAGSPTAVGLRKGPRRQPDDARTFPFTEN